MAIDKDDLKTEYFNIEETDKEFRIVEDATKAQKLSKKNKPYNLYELKVKGADGEKKKLSMFKADYRGMCTTLSGSKDVIPDTLVGSKWKVRRLKTGEKTEDGADKTELVLTLVAKN